MNKVIASVTVSLFGDGNIKVDGPLENKILCYGLLEGAKFAVRDYIPLVIAKDIPHLDGKSN